MDKITLGFRVFHQHIDRLDRIVPVAGAKNYFTAKFVFSPEWDGLTKTAIFKNGSDKYTQILTNDSCDVPWEVIKEGSVLISVFGGDLITVDECEVKILKSGYAQGSTPADPTPTVYQQILSDLEDKVDEADLDGTSIYKGADNKIHAKTGSDIINDNTVGTNTTYSSSKIASLNAGNVKSADLDGTSIYKGADNKIHAMAGAVIDDDETSNVKVWSSGKVYNELESAKSEFVLLDDFDVLEDVVADNTTNIAENDKRIEQLFKLTKGQIWDFENKVESGTNAKVSGAMYESILDVRGNTKQTTYGGYQLLKLNDSTETKDGITVSVSNGIISVSGSSTKTSSYSSFVLSVANAPLDEDTYTISVDHKIIGIGFTTKAIATLNFAMTDTVTSKTKVTAFSAKGLTVNVSYDVTNINDSFKFMLEKGSTAHDYEPYAGGIPSPSPSYPQNVVGVTELNITVGTQTRKITPPHTLYKVEDYADYLDVESGKWIKKINKYHITKSTSSKDYSGKLFAFGKISDSLNITNTSKNICMCPLYKGYGLTNVRTIDYGICIYTSNLFVRNADVTTLSLDTDIYYPLAEETTSDVNADDLAWIKSLDGTDADKTITITDQNGNDVSYLVEYLVKLSEVVTNE